MAQRRRSEREYPAGPFSFLSFAIDDDGRTARLNKIMKPILLMLALVFLILFAVALLAVIVLSAFGVSTTWMEMGLSTLASAIGVALIAYAASWLRSRRQARPDEAGADGGGQTGQGGQGGQAGRSNDAPADEPASS